MKHKCIFRLVLRCLLVARKENLTSVSKGLTGRPTGFHLCTKEGLKSHARFYLCRKMYPALHCVEQSHFKRITNRGLED